MSPSTIMAASQLHQLIYYQLDNELLDTANFLAGRLYALEPRNPDSSHLLALTYLRLRRFKAAYDSSHKYGANGRHLGCAYVYAQACLQLGRYLEGCTALEKAKSSWMGKLNWKKHSETTRRHLPDTPAVYTLMGKLWQAHGDPKKAGDCFIEAHKTCPFTWEAFEGLCRIGADLNVANMFRVPASTAGSTETSLQVDIYTDEPRPLIQQVAAQSSINRQIWTPSTDSFNAEFPSSASEQVTLPDPRQTAAPTGSYNSAWDTPRSNGHDALDDDAAQGGGALLEVGDTMQPPAAPGRRVKHTTQPEAMGRPRLPTLRGHTHSSSDTVVAEDPCKPSLGGHKRTISGQASQASSASDPSAQPRRSNRLFGQGVSSKITPAPVDDTAARTDRGTRAPKVATGTKGRTVSTVGRVVSGNRKVLPPDPAEKDKDRRAPSRTGERLAVPGVTAVAIQKPQAPTPTIIEGQHESDITSALLDNLRQLALGCHSTAVFHLPQAIQTFRSLPAAQRETPWVLAQLGKAYYEQADYRAAEETFARLLKLQPSRVDDMEVYSTVLWHLKKEATLAHLCHLLRDQDFHAPQTWCAIGNAFSLAREHDQAIAAFKRAVQVDDRFAYAWTLMGHEYIANEEYEAALSAFRRSVAIDHRCYGGWYGLGKSYERIGSLEEAERHYRIAAAINPSNATLLVCIGVVLERLRNRKAALANYTQALEIAPASALARFKRARVLMQMRHFAQALAELEVLRDQAPDEANVWFLLGKCYKGLGKKSEALKALTTALNLDVKAAPFIKDAMEALDDDEDESEED